MYTDDTTNFYSTTKRGVIFFSCLAILEKTDEKLAFLLSILEKNLSFNGLYFSSKMAPQ